MVALILSALAACGTDGDGGTSATPTGAGNSAADYAQCLQSQGLVMEQFTAEDGTTQSRPDKERNDISKVTTAAEACKDKLPTETGTGDNTLTAEDIENRRKYSACIREKGVPEFPDPDARTGEFVMNDELSRRVKENPAMRTAMEACRDKLPGDTGGVIGG